MNLSELGWNDFFDEHFEQFRQQGFSPARIAITQKYTYFVYNKQGEFSAKLSGKFRYHAHSRKDFPVVGDWVTILSEKHQAIIHALLPRKNSLTRKPPISGGRKERTIGGRTMIDGGATEEQVIAANIDTAFIVVSLDTNFNLRRIERYLTLLHNRGITPVILLNKADLCSDITGHCEQVEAIAESVAIHAMSATENQGLDVLRTYLSPGKTIAFLGSSGVGKSTIINQLLGQERQKTDAISKVTGKGKHITSNRELILFPTGGLLIDSPGMRELQLWVEEENLSDYFKDIEDLVAQCRFRNCTHTAEPGCTVREAIENGFLNMHRYEGYLRQKQEVQHLSKRKIGKYHLLVKAKKRAIKKKDDQRISHEAF